MILYMFLVVHGSLEDDMKVFGKFIVDLVAEYTMAWDTSTHCYNSFSIRETVNISQFPEHFPALPQG